MKQTGHCIIRSVLVLALLAIPAVCQAHSAMCNCMDNGDGTITCEGGFSDGSSAEGVRIFVRQMDDATLIRGKMDKDSEFTFKKPDMEYKVIFDAGPGHQVTIDSGEITE